MNVHRWASRALPCLIQDVGLTEDAEDRVSEALRLIMTRPSWVKDLADSAVQFDIWLETQVPPVFDEDAQMQVLLDGFTEACSPHRNAVCGMACWQQSIHKIQLVRSILFSCKKWECVDGDDQDEHHRLAYGDVGSDSARRFISGQRDLGDSCKAIPSKLVLIENEVKRLLSQALCSYSNEKFEPRMGPGAVFEGLNPLEKWWCLDKFIPERLAKQFGVESFTSGLNGVADQDGLTSPTGDTDSEARIAVVPKDMWKMRVITIPKLHYGWAQQGVRSKLVASMGRSALTRHLDLFDQTKQGKLALTGSVSGELATLDFTDASDRISWSQVRRIFPEEVVRDLEAIRADRFIWSDGETTETVENFSFDGMGNAATFVVETLTFWGYCQAVANLAGLSGQVSVYGDDVIVPYTHVPLVIPMFDLCGWKLNSSKSFFKTGGVFRESCGVHAFRGYNVTPLRFTGYSTSELGSACRLASQLSHFHEISPSLSRMLLQEFAIANFRGAPEGADCVDIADLPSKPPLYRYYRPTQQWEAYGLTAVPKTVGLDICSWGTVLSGLLGYSLSHSLGVTNPRPKDRSKNFRKAYKHSFGSEFGRPWLVAPLPRRVTYVWAWLTTTPSRLPETSGRLPSPAQHQQLWMDWVTQKCPTTSGGETQR